MKRILSLSLPCLLVTASGCMSAADTALEDSTGLQASERTALNASLQAIEALSVAASTVQGSTNMPSDALSAREKEMPSLGTCPAVSVDTSKLSSLSLQMTLDFGQDGCSPFHSDYMVSGSASGTLQLLEQNVVVTFDDLDSNGHMLRGGMEVTFSNGDSDVALDGSWDLHSNEIRTTGDGEVAYERTTAITTLRDFAGTNSSDDGSWTLQAETVAVDPGEYENFIPFAGTLRFAGDDTRPIEVRFDEDSPATGLVTVSINDGPAIQISLFEL